MRLETKELNAKVQDAGAKAQEAWSRGAEFEHVVESLKLNREKQEWLNKNLEELKQGLKERHESDDWLKNELDQYEERMNLHEEHKQQQTKKYESLRHSIEEIRDRLRKRHIEAGKYEEQKASHEQQIKRRGALIQETARHHNIRGYDNHLDNLQVQEFMAKISKLRKDQSAAVDQARRNAECEMQSAQQALSRLGEQRSALLESKNLTRQQLTSNDRKIGFVQSELNSIEVDEGGKAVLEINLEDLQTQLTNSNAELKIASWDNKIQESNSLLRSIDNDTDILNQELILTTKQAGELARLDHLNSEMRNSRLNLDTMVGAYDERLRSIVGQNWHFSKLETDFRRVMEQRTQEVNEAARQRDLVSRTLEQTEYQLQSCRAELKKGENELDAYAQAVGQNTQGDVEDYPEYIKEIQINRDVLRADVDNYVNVRKFYNDSIKYSEKHEKCKLCLRKFHTSQERQKFVENMEKKIVQNTIEDLQKQLNEIEIELEEAKQAGPRYDAWVRLSKTELPRLRSEVKQLEETRARLLREIEEHDKKVSDLEQAKTDVETLTKPVASILKYSLDIDNLKLQTQEAVAKQGATGLSRTVDEIQEELKAMGERARIARENIAKLTAGRERARSHNSALELELSKAKNNLVTANHQLEKKSNILKQVEDLRIINQEHRDVIKRLEEQLQSLAPRIAEEETKLDDIKQRGASKGKRLYQIANELSDSVHRLELANQSIQAYIAEDGPSKLAGCQREIENAQQDIERTESEQKQVVIEINKITEQLRNHQETKRAILENIKYRRSLKELESVQSEITKLSVQNNGADLEHYKKQAAYWQHQYKLLSTAETSKMGIMKAKDDHLMQLLNDWNTDHKDAASKYKESHIKVEVVLSLPLIGSISVNFVRLLKLRWKIWVGMGVL